MTDQEKSQIRQVISKSRRTTWGYLPFMMKEAVLAVSLSITATFALLALLARQSYRQVRLLKAVATDLGLDELI